MSEAYYSRSNPITDEQLAEAIRVNGSHPFERAEQAVMRVLERLQELLDDPLGQAMWSARQLALR